MAYTSSLSVSLLDQRIHLVTDFSGTDAIHLFNVSFFRYDNAVTSPTALNLSISKYSSVYEGKH